MKMETDPKIIERLAREREEENWEFRRFLKDLPIEDWDFKSRVVRALLGSCRRVGNIHLQQQTLPHAP
jgi:hypothetical protein